MNGNDRSVAEQEWMNAVAAFQCVTQAMQTQLDSLQYKAQQLNSNLCRRAAGLIKGGRAMDRDADTLALQIRLSIETWTRDWSHGEMARSLSDSLSDRLVLLVYGKVNAGKSSLMNFLVERFAANGIAARRFRLIDGKKCFIDDSFAEGATETTSQIQGAEIGSNLVLLDSPGLLSVSRDNHALTEQYIAAADGALLLTSSGAPCQVQEVDVLKVAVESNRPVITVISRSDTNSFKVVDGATKPQLINKGPERRASQETHVLALAGELVADSGKEALIRQPISVSVRCAIQDHCSPQALADAGIDRLYGALTLLAAEALAYKRRKPLEIYREHLNKVVCHGLQSEHIPLLVHLRESGSQARQTLRSAQQPIVEDTYGEILRELPTLVDRHQHSRDRKALAEELSQLVSESLAVTLAARLADYQARTQRILLAFDDQQFRDYVEDTVEIEQLTGHGWRAAGSAGGTLLGIGLGAGFGPAGMAAGSIIGGWLGRTVGNLAISTKIVRECVGLDGTELLLSIQQQLHRGLENVVAQHVERCCNKLDLRNRQLDDIAAHIETFIRETRAWADTSSANAQRLLHHQSSSPRGTGHEHANRTLLRT